MAKKSKQTQGVDVFERCHDDGCCIFTEVLKNIDTGILILDRDKQEVYFTNLYADNLLDFIGAGHQYDQIRSMLGGINDLDKPGTKQSTRSIINCGHRSFGYTAYSLEGNRRYMAVFIQDVTDQSRLEAIDEASEMMNNISYLFSGIRHEIGNPLNSMKMALTVVQNNMGKFSQDELQVYLDRLSGDVQKMEVLLKSFKNFNMFEKPKTAAVDLEEFFSSLTHLIGADIRNKSIEIKIDLLAEARWVKVDARAMQHVAMNILANAMDALEGVETPTLGIKGETVNDLVLISIIDNGCGMPKELIRDVFKPFYTTKPHGTGLGLVISKKMLSQMNCGIEISSVEDVGTTVTLSLPRCAPPDGSPDYSTL